jgi:hypothetical protein
MGLDALLATNFAVYSLQSSHYSLPKASNAIGRHLFMVPTLIFPHSNTVRAAVPGIEQLLNSLSRKYRHLATLATVAMGLDALLATNFAVCRLQTSSDNFL